MSQTQETTRRNFLKTTGIVAASLSVSRSAHAAGDDLMRIALVGCGGRGSGAIRDRLQVGDNAKVVAIADAFEPRAKNLAEGLRDDEDYKAKVDLPDERVFSGLEGYKRAIDCLKPGDMAVIATTPGFRPFHYRYAIENGIHVFLEKPLFVDAPGYRHVMETNKKADEKNLKVCVGLQRLYEPHYYNWVDQINGGTIGDVMYSRVFWTGGGIWCNGRKRGESEMEYQMRNWYHFVWLCGDNICEQHVHNLHIGNWVHGKGDPMAHPIFANGQGGRQDLAAPEHVLRTAPKYADQDAWWQWYDKNKDSCNRYGQARDHYFVEFEYANGSHMFSQSRHISNCFDSVTELIYGSKGYGQAGWLNNREGQQIWRNNERAKKGPYQWEHDMLVDAVRNDKPRNDGWHAAQATMTAVLGREAAFCGKVVYWDELVEKGKPYMSYPEPTSFAQNPPVMPDADGFYEESVAQQGKYNVFV